MTYYRNNDWGLLQLVFVVIVFFLYCVKHAFNAPFDGAYIGGG
jgi:hypothetical protein